MTQQPGNPMQAYCQILYSGLQALMHFIIPHFHHLTTPTINKHSHAFDLVPRLHLQK